MMRTDGFTDYDDLAPKLKKQALRILHGIKHLVLKTGDPSNFAFRIMKSGNLSRAHQDRKPSTIHERELRRMVDEAFSLPVREAPEKGGITHHRTTRFSLGKER